MDSSEVLALLERYLKLKGEESSGIADALSQNEYFSDLLAKDIGRREMQNLVTEVENSKEILTSYYKDKSIPTLKDRWDRVQRTVPTLVKILRNCFCSKTFVDESNELVRRALNFDDSISSSGKRQKT